jgi:N-acetylglucosaminyl-diphospho-decaprenol L-rhamnosyltransferase
MRTDDTSRMDVAVVIPTLDARELLADALESLARQTLPPRVVVVDNGSSDATAEMVRSRFPDVELVRNEQNLGFGRAINSVALQLDADALVLVNNDVVCDERFVERICAPLATGAGMAAGVLTQSERPDRIDTAGLELDTTLRAWDYFRDRPVAELRPETPAPLGPCGGAAAYRLAAFRDLGGFDENLFVYGEDVDLAIRMREAGWSCELAHAALAEHRHSATLGARSSRQTALDAFARGYLLGKYAPWRRRPIGRLLAAAFDWPLLLADALRLRELSPVRERIRGIRTGRRTGSAPLARTPSAISFPQAIARQVRLFRVSPLRKRLTAKAGRADF